MDDPTHDRPLGDVDDGHVAGRLARDVEQLGVAGEDRVGRPGRDLDPAVDFLRLQVIEDDFVVARVARPVEHQQVTAVGGEGQIVGIAPDLHAADELPRLGVDHAQVAALVVDDPRRLAVGVEDDPVGLALAERNRAHGLEGLGVEDRDRIGLGIGDVERRPRRRRGGGQHHDQEEDTEGFQHGYLT